MKLNQISLAGLSAFLLILSFPNFNYEPLAWVALIPLFWAIRDLPPARAALAGWISGFAFFTGVLPWIFNVLSHYGHLPGPVSVFLLLVLTAYLALFFSAFAFLMRWVKSKIDVPDILLAPALWVSLEYLRGVLLSGFPWALLGYSQFLTLPLVQIADTTGVYGVSFLIVLVNAALCRFLQASLERRVKPALKEVVAAGLLVAVTAGYGYARLDEMKAGNPSGTPVRIGLIQGNIPQDIKWEPKFQEETFRTYTDLTLRTFPARPNLVIWPETALPFFFQDAPAYQSRMMDLSERMGAPILFGSPAFRGKGRDTRYYNSAFLISPERRVAGRYDKIHLVPFGEYAPLSGILWFTRDIIGALGDFESGEDVVNLSIAEGTFGVLICYEAIFPELTRQFVARGARFLVNITNDAWFGRSAAPYQHLSMVRLRAIENRVPIARAANTGISGFIDPAGRVLQSSDIFTKAILSDTIYLKRIESFYARFGDLFTYVCLALSALFLIFAGTRRGTRGQ